MKNALGLLEIKTVAEGIHVADAMLKAADIDLIMAQPLCPGKYVVMVGGNVGAVQSAVRDGKTIGADSIVDEFVLPNAHPSVFPALAGCTEVGELKSLGIIESYSVASAIIAADTAVKAAHVELLEIRIARGLGGKSVVSLTGDVGAVAAAVRAGCNSIGDSGFLVSQLVLPAPHKALYQALF